ncbi:MAG: HlyD family efflux transporter periplasmic adaptor subunit [Muribaculaceae bacterium]|nr:HlyD family efflux transporter periplasmic adaptor subunit [Muribaculaceae bacterium]
MDREIPNSERRKAKRIRLFKIGGTAVAVIAGAIALGSMMRASVAQSDLIVGTADTGTIEVTVTGTGTVSPAFEEIITSPINSRILEVYCRAGDSVKAGTPLLLLDLQSTENEVNRLSDEIAMKHHELDQQRVTSDTRLSDLAMQVKVKEMTLSRLEAELRNERYLDSIGSGTGDRVRQAELAVSTGRLELEQMRQQLANEKRISRASEDVKHLDIDIASRNLNEMSRTLSDARVSSPRNATLTFIHDQIGEKVSEGQKIAVISDLGHFRVDAEISDSYASKVGVGSQAVVRIGKERLKGVVSNLTPQSQNGVIKFTVRLEDDAHPRLRSGLKTDVYVACDVVDEAIRIPNGSYYTGPGTYSLFFMSADGKKLEKHDVKLGSSNYEFVEVQSGMRPGDRVVLSDMTRFKDSSSLRVR